MIVQHRQITDDLRRQIASGAFPSGSCLPSEAEIARQYGVSRTTVRRAIVALQMEELIDTRQGARRTVLQPERSQSFGELVGFADWAIRSGRVPSGLIISRERRPATPDQAADFRVATGRQLLHVLRLRTLDGEPIMVERTTYAPRAGEIVDQLPADVQSILREIGGSSGITAGRGRHTIDAVAAGSTDASLLSVRRSGPLLRHRYFITTTDDEPYFFSDDRYKAGAMAITFDNAVATNGISRQVIRSMPRAAVPSQFRQNAEPDENP